MTNNQPTHPVHLRPKQRRHRPHPLRQPQSRLRRLLLPRHHGHILEIRRRARFDPRARPRRPHDLPLQLGGRVGNPHHFDRAVHETETVNLDGGDVVGVRGDFGTELVFVRVYVQGRESGEGRVFQCDCFGYGDGVCWYIHSSSPSLLFFCHFQKALTGI